MTLQPIIGAALVSTAVPLALWAVSRPGTPGIDPGKHLRRAVARPLDLRDLDLQRGAAERLAGAVTSRLAAAARRATPANAVARVEQHLAAAGLHWSIERFFATKVLLFAVGAVVGLVRLAAAPSPLMVILATALMAGGWFGPDSILTSRAGRRRETIRRELPDTIDQVTIAVEAGLGFEAALARVAANGKGPLAEELIRALQDVQLGVPRDEALGALADRIELPEMRRLVAAISQSERYGVAIANVLHIQAAELRERRRQRAEEHAMKIPVKVVLPLVFCILPALFIVILGPAAVRFMENGIGT